MKLLILSLFFSFHTYAQSAEEQMDSFSKEREKMLREAIEMFRGIGAGDDSFFDDSREHGARGSSFSITQTNESSGAVSILITPEKDVKLDIKTDKRVITITAEKSVKVQNQGEQGSSFSSSTSTQMQTIAIPRGYISKGPDAIKGGLKIVLMPKGAKRIKGINKNNTRKTPLGRQIGEETI